MRQAVGPNGAIILEELTPHLVTIRFQNIDPDPAVNTEQAKAFEAAILTLYSRHPGELIDFLVDATQVGHVNYVSAGARRHYKRTYHLPQTGNVAFFGMGTWLKLMTKIFTHLFSRERQAAWFDTEAEALAWLQQKRAHPPDKGE